MSEGTVIESVTPDMEGEKPATLATTSMNENPIVPIGQTLGEGTILEFVPHDNTQPADDNLHEAARLILECAEPTVFHDKPQNEQISSFSHWGSKDLVVQSLEESVQAGGGSDANVFVLETEGENGLECLSENDPVRIIRSSNIPRKGFCTGCQKIVEYKNRKRHLMSVHQIVQANESKMTKCIHPDCHREFYMIKSMMKHLETDHAVEVGTKELTFPTWQEFMKWKTTEEDTNFVFFSKRSGECVRAGRSVSYYVCQRDGSMKPHRKKGYVASGRTTKRGRARQDLTCPARMKAYRSNDSVKVIYTFSHNHPISPHDTVHQPLSKHKVDKIKHQLQKGVNSERIHANFSSVEIEADGFKEPSHIVTKRRIDNIKKKLDKENRLNSDESASVHMLVSRMQEEEHSPVLLYICECIYDQDRQVYASQLNDPSKFFVFFYQSQRQYEMFVQYASKALIVDTDGSTDDNENQLINFIVSDDFDRAYPVGHIITNNLQTGLQLSIEKLKERLPETFELSVVFTPNESIYPMVINTIVSSCEPKYYVGRWETVREWEKKIKMTIFSSTIRRDLSQMMCMLLDESDPIRFEILLEVFLKEFASKAERFVKTFEKNYPYVKSHWAKCYRDFEHYGTDTAEFMRKLTSRLDWWVAERSSNKRIDDLVNLLVRIDEEWWTQRQIDLERYSHLVGTELSKHVLSTMISGERIHPVKLHDEGIRIWFVKGDDQNASYVVKFVQEPCEADFCWDKCVEESCEGLCAHIYICSCEEGTALCEHVHRVRSFCNRSDDNNQTHSDDNPQTSGGNHVRALLANTMDFELCEGMEVVIVDNNDLSEAAHYVQLEGIVAVENEHSSGGEVPIQTTSSESQEAVLYVTE